MKKLPMIATAIHIAILSVCTLANTCIAQTETAHHHHHHRHGRAMIYADKYIGKKTASGEVYDPCKMTAASPHWPLGSVVEVTHAVTGKSLKVRINDKASSAGGLVVDLSKSAARHLGIHDTAPVTVKLVSKDGVL